MAAFCGYHHDMPDPNRAINHFARLGLEPCFEVDLRDLERRYLALCSEVHPDRAGPDAQPQAIQATSRLNESYRVLRDVVSRAEYLLLLQGGVPAEQDHSLPEGFLQLVLELREELDAAKERDDRARVDSLMRSITMQRDQLLASIRQGFLEPPTAPGLRDIRRDLNAIRYLSRLLQGA
jgi:molecular chaperone HscB